MILIGRDAGGKGAVASALGVFGVVTATWCRSCFSPLVCRFRFFSVFSSVFNFPN